MKYSKADDKCLTRFYYIIIEYKASTHYKIDLIKYESQKGNTRAKFNVKCTLISRDNLHNPLYINA